MFFPPAYAQSQGAIDGGAFQIVFLVGLIVLFYVMLIRPQRKRQKEHQSMVAALEKGDEIVTASGILGRITQIEDHYIHVNVASDVTLKMQRDAVRAVLPKGTLSGKTA